MIMYAFLEEIKPGKHRAPMFKKYEKAKKHLDDVVRRGGKITRGIFPVQVEDDKGENE